MLFGHHQDSKNTSPCICLLGNALGNSHKSFLQIAFNISIMYLEFRKHACHTKALHVKTEKKYPQPPVCCICFYLTKLSISMYSMLFKGAAVGCLFGMGFGTWISVGNYLFGTHWEALPVPTSNCFSNLNNTVTLFNTTSYMTTGDPLLTTAIANMEPWVQEIYCNRKCQDYVYIKWEYWSTM